MRTYGRVTNQDGSRTWVQVDTDAQGFSDMVWLTTLAQVLQLNLNESPFFANYGIPAQQSVITQVQPDYYMAFTQQQFAPYFAVLLLSKDPQQPPDFAPVYRINVTTHQGVKLNASVPIPT